MGNGRGKERRKTDLQEGLCPWRPRLEHDGENGKEDDLDEADKVLNNSKVDVQEKLKCKIDYVIND